MTYQAALKALADPTRREILEQLRSGPAAVSELALQFPVSRPAVSQHLRVLRDAGLVRQRSAGTRHIYSIELRGLEDLREYLDHFWVDVLEAFRTEAESGRRDEGPGNEKGGEHDS